MWEGRSLGLYSYISTKYIQVGLSVLLIYITRESKPYTVDEVEWWPHFSFVMPFNIKQVLNRIAGSWMHK